MGALLTTVVGPFFEMLRSASGVFVPPDTSVVAVVVVLKFWAERVPATAAVLLMVAPFAALTLPRIVTIHDPLPSIVPPWHVTSVVVCVQLPRELVICSWGGTPMPPTPFSWSVITTFVSFDPPVLIIVIV